MCHVSHNTHLQSDIMSPIDPPFRADHVGSLLRPKAVLDAREQFAAGSITAAEKRAVEDEAIADAVRQVESVGMRSITDGEFRRTWFHLDFLEQLAGVEVSGAIAASSNAAETVHFTPPRLAVTGPLRHVHDIQVDDFKYLAGVTTQTPKVSIPSPTMVHFRGGRAAIDIESYPDLDVFFADLAQCYRDEIAALYAAGCRYIQLDDTNLAYLCDPKMRAGAVERGDDPNELPRTYAALINDALEGPARRSHRRHPPVPRQLPQHVVRRGRLRAGRRGAVRRPRCRRLLPRVRRRAFRRLRPAAVRPRRQDRRVRV